MATTVIRYASYLEQKHADFLVTSERLFTDLYLFSPYEDYVNTTIVNGIITDIRFVEYLDFSTVLYGLGNTINDLTAMSDMFDTYMTDVDIDLLWTTTLADVQNNTVVDNMVTAQADLLSDEIEEVSLPRFTTGLRDINAVISSTFATGRAIIESARTKKIAEFDASLRYKLIPVAADQWKTKLTWNQNIITTYQNMITMMIGTELNEEELNLDRKERFVLWQYKLLDFHRANLGVMQGAQSSTSNTSGPSKISSAIGGGMAGAASGAMIGSVVPGIGTGVGAAVGGILGIGSAFF